MKKSALKRTLLVTAICSVVFMLAFVAMLVLMPVIMYGAIGSEMPQDAIGNSLTAIFKLLGAAFVIPFNETTAAEFAAASGFSEVSTVLTISIVTYVLAGLLFIGLVLSIVFVCVKKKGGYLFYVLPYLIGSAVSLVTLTSGGFINLAYLMGATMAKLTGVIVSIYALWILGGLSFVTMVVTVVLGLISASKEAKAKAVEVEEAAPSIAEAVGDPEAVQEGEELSAPVEPMVIEAEPEPVSEEVSETPAEVEPEAEEAKAEEEPKVEEEPKPEEKVSANSLNQESLAALLREVVRDIVRDEMARSQQAQQQPQQNSSSQAITGATFGGPLVVQYFNGGINGVTPAAAPAPAVEVKTEPAPVVEEKKEEPSPVVEEKKEEPVAAPAPTPLFTKKEKPAEPEVKVENPEAPVVEEKKYERISFAERLLKSEKDVHDLYNEIKNEILSYGVKSRISSVGDTFRLHKKMYVRITVAGKSLKLYFALNPADYANSTLPIQDASNKDMYVDIPLVFKVKSPLSVRRCKELIQDVMEKDGLEQGEIGKVNWIKELKAEMANSKKPEKEEE